MTLISCLPEPLEAVTTPTPPPANVKIKMVPRGKVVGFRCGTKNPRSLPKVRSADQYFILKHEEKQNELILVEINLSPLLIKAQVVSAEKCQ